MLNNDFGLLEELLSPASVGRALDNRAEDFHPGSLAGYEQARVDSLVWAYRDVGYLYADLNPLGESYSEIFTSLARVKESSYHRLGLEDFGLSESDAEREFYVGGGMRRRMRLREIVEVFRAAYCGEVGLEFLHIQNKEMREWLIDRMEAPSGPPALGDTRRRRLLEDLVEAEELERFLHGTFVGQRRFSLEGSEAVIPALRALTDGTLARGIERVVMGAAHRGRLTILALIVGKPLEELFYLFEEGFTPGVYGGSDDVKYHIGHSSTLRREDGSSLEISLTPNASHLESAGPIVEGRARGLQDLLGDEGRKRVLPVILHGEAAFSGQGVVTEVFNLSQLEGYSAGGTIHVVIDNQIGFTTPSRNAHSNLNPTDIAKMNPVPVFHVNGDRPEAVVRVMEAALDFRQAFGSDVVVDILCYRRHGHNEGDEPSFTHPRMYELIKSHPSVAALYGDACAASGLFAPGELEGMRRDYRAALEAALSREREAVRAAAAGPSAAGPSAETRIGLPELSRIVEGLYAPPPGFEIHDKLRSIAAGKLAAFKEKGLLDWATAETAAFGSLLLEGLRVRLSGEDAARGTFSQRHLEWWETGARAGASSYLPLDHLSPGQRKMEVYDSPLSEFGVLGFEYGYASEQKDALVMWEAQFGDFCNGGQVVIDNYVAAAEAKWGSRNGLVLLLPHGYEGQGPEHSSAHLERFLLLCADGNLRVANPSTPAQYFHLLRAQAKDPSKKPLIVMTPKSLLRNPAAVSPVSAFLGPGFLPAIDDPAVAKEPAARRGVSRLLLCSGRIYYELARMKEAGKREDIAIVRIERLYPFPAGELRELLASYPKARSFAWVQEESRNRGAWGYARDRFEEAFPSLALGYVGRKASASPATGSHERHASEEAALLAAAFGGASEA